MVWNNEIISSNFGKYLIPTWRLILTLHDITFANKIVDLIPNLKLCICMPLPTMVLPFESEWGDMSWGHPSGTSNRDTLKNAKGDSKLP
jgi:hypothetical protein